MLSLFSSPKPRTKGGKRAKSAKQRAYYSDPLPFPPPPPSFNLFSPSTYKSLFQPSASHSPYKGIWSPETRSVNISNDIEGVDIWRRGMWGKGVLSRSQPAWRERKTKEMTGGRQLSLEEITALKRKERAEFKEERIKRERVERERLLRAEGKSTNEEDVKDEEVEEDQLEPTAKRKRRKLQLPVQEELPVYSEEYLDKEVLQLSPEEALFLLQLDLLTIEYKGTPLSLSQFLHQVAGTSQSDDPFIVHYVVYYYFRRERIIVKPGLKFGVDYLLYDKPIPFTHAANCVNVVGSYHRWVKDTGTRLMRESITWQEINLWQRLMGNVKKRLKLVYVDIPPRSELEDWRDVDGKDGFMEILQKYRVREVSNSRLVLGRERDVKPEK
jgi:tRNA-splicing endonuclease subunit Sen2